MCEGQVSEGYQGDQHLGDVLKGKSGQLTPVGCVRQRSGRSGARAGLIGPGLHRFGREEGDAGSDLLTESDAGETLVAGHGTVTRTCRA